ncbi:MAG TPA: hypothetical protein VFC93_03785 [Chloroflexota bacterium]|nr:hypothetical protein [Chloroflexota bacterium]
MEDVPITWCLYRRVARGRRYAWALCRAGWGEADLRRSIEAHRAAGDVLRIVRDPEPCPPRLIPL